MKGRSVIIVVKKHSFHITRYWLGFASISTFYDSTQNIMFGNFVEKKVSDRNLSTFSLDTIGLALTVDIHVSANSLATSYDYRILDSDRIREHLELVPEYEASNLLKFFKRKFM